MNRINLLATAGVLWLAQFCQGADPLDNWSLQRSGTSEFFNSVGYGNGRFVVVGNDTNAMGVILTSSGGTNWTQAAGGMTNYLSDVCFGAGKFVIVGDNGKILVSPNGTDWTPRDSGVTFPLTSVAFGHGLFIAAGLSYKGLTSADGINWTPITVDFAPSFKTIRFANDQFLMIRDGSQIQTSTNGSNWINRFFTRPGTSYSGINYGNGRYVVVGSRGQIGGNGNIAISPDTLTWTPLDIGQTNTLYSVAYGSGLFVAVGGLNGGLSGLIFSSPDGANWSAHPPGTRGWLADVRYANGRFIAVGSSGTILLSQPVLHLEPLAGTALGAWRCKLTAPAGQTVSIQASTDLTDWVDLTNVVMTSETGEFVNPAATDESRRFFRAVLP